MAERNLALAECSRPWCHRPARPGFRRCEYHSREWKTPRAKALNRLAGRKYRQTEKGKKTQREHKQKQMTPEGLTKSREYQRGYRERNRHRRYAQSVVANAIRYYGLERQPCEQCGELRGTAHHDDYGKPWKIRWLCQRCHSRHHAESELPLEVVST